MKRTILSLLFVGIASLFLAGDPALTLPFVGLMLPGFGLWPTEPYAIAMMIVDAIAATVILYRPAGKAQALVGLTFLLQIGVHAGRLMNGEAADLNLYWWGLSLLAFLQIFVVGGWWIHERVSRRGAVHADGPISRPAYHKGVD